MPIIKSPSNCRWSLWFPYECGGGSVLSRGRFVNKPTTAENTSISRLTNRPRLRTLPPPHTYGNQRLQRQLVGLLMMGIVMSETCWAVSVRQSNKFYDWLLHLFGCFVRVGIVVFGNICDEWCSGVDTRKKWRKFHREVYCNFYLFLNIINP
jgi:hypothetical protein